jgi:hypothetical protein
MTVGPYGYYCVIGSHYFFFLTCQMSTHSLERTCSRAILRRESSRETYSATMKSLEPRTNSVEKYVIKMVTITIIIGSSSNIY